MGLTLQRYTLCRGWMMMVILHSTHNYELMREFFLNADTLIGHNIVRYDVPVVEKILGIKDQG